MIATQTTIPAAPDPVLLALSLASLGPIPAPARVPVISFVEPPRVAPKMSREAALAECEGLVTNAAKKLRHVGRAYGDVNDLAQEGRIAVLRALEKHDGSRPFEVFATTVVYNHLKGLIRNARGRRHPKLQLHDAADVDDCADGPALRVDACQHKAFVDAEERAGLAGMLAQLPTRTRAMVEGHMAGISNEELGALHGVSGLRVWQIVRAAVDNMHRARAPKNGLHFPRSG